MSKQPSRGRLDYLTVHSAADPGPLSLSPSVRASLVDLLADLLVCDFQEHPGPTDKTLNCSVRETGLHNKINQLSEPSNGSMTEHSNGSNPRPDDWRDAQGHSKRRFSPVVNVSKSPV